MDSNLQNLKCCKNSMSRIKLPSDESPHLKIWSGYIELQEVIMNKSGGVYWSMAKGNLAEPKFGLQPTWSSEQSTAPATNMDHNRSERKKRLRQLENRQERTVFCLFSNWVVLTTIPWPNLRKTLPTNTELKLCRSVLLMVALIISRVLYRTMVLH